MSVILPIYNAAEHLEACITSVRKQTFPDIEIVCVNDASTDSSWEILQDLARFDRVIRPVNLRRNGGAGAARNVGLSHARGDYVMFVDADDLLPATAIEKLYMTVVRDRVPMARGNIAGIKSQEPLGTPVPKRSNITFYEEPALWIPWYHVTYIFKRRALRPFGPRYPTLASGEDPVFLAGVLVKCRDISCLDETVYWYREKDELRKTHRHLLDHIRHAAMVRSIFYRAGCGHCWDNGYAYFSFRELSRLIDRSGLPKELYWQCRNQLIAIYPEYPALHLRYQLEIDPWAVLDARGAIRQLTSVGGAQ